VDGWEEGKSMAISGDTNGAIMMWNLKVVLLFGQKLALIDITVFDVTASQA